MQQLEIHTPKCYLRLEHKPQIHLRPLYSTETFCHLWHISVGFGCKCSIENTIAHSMFGVRVRVSLGPFRGDTYLNLFCSLCSINNQCKYFCRMMPSRWAAVKLRLNPENPRHKDLQGDCWVLNFLMAKLVFMFV